LETTLQTIHTENLVLASPKTQSWILCNQDMKSLSSTVPSQSIVQLRDKLPLGAMSAQGLLLVQRVEASPPDIIRPFASELTLFAKA
jgi:hypothetical protein